VRYLIINGSPRKGNTWKLVELAKSQLLEIDDTTEFEEIHLANVNLPFCIGCSNCFRLGHEKCPHYSITNNIIQAIEKADGVIISSTTYNTRETALLKNLFDHFCYMLHRPCFFKSKALVITTTGGVGAKSAAKSIASTLKGIGFNRCYLFSCSSISWNNYIPKEKSKAYLRKTVAKFNKDVLSKKLHSPSYLVLIPYNLFRGMSLHYTKGSEYETKDGEHWTDSERKNTVYDKSVKVPPHKILFGNMFYLLGKTIGKNKNMMVTYKKSE
jgi:multimeric flavodoxin WrbA